MSREKIDARLIAGIKKTIAEVLCGRYWPLLLLGLLIIFTLMRGIRINADAPPELSISAALYTDEGFKTLSAKNRVLFGDWKWSPLDQYSSWHDQSPVPTYLYYRWFSWFGISFASIRYLNVVIALFCMALLFFFVKKRYDNVSAFLALFMFGVSHFSSMYQRMGFFENLLILFSILICISVFYIYDSRAKLKTVLQNRKIRPSKEIAKLLFYVTVGCLATLGGIYTKQSIVLILVALLPFFYLYFLFSHHRLNRYVIKNFYLMLVVIVGGYFFIAHFEAFETITYSLLDLEIFDVKLGFLLPFQRGSGNFDPVYLMFLKSLFIEFIFLQPVIFYSAFFFALYTFHNFLYRDKLHIPDMIFSSWFLFGFIFLSILKYHPSRYYLILSMPIFILSARFFTYPEKRDLARLVELEKKMSLRRVIGALLKFYFIFNLGTSLLMMILPNSVKKYVYDDFYFKFSSQRYVETIPTILVLASWILLVFLVSLPLMSHLYRAMEKKRFYIALFALMLFLQFFQYSKWLLFSKDNQYHLTQKIDRVLPANAALTGGWSAGLAIGNTIRPIVIQEDLNYNIDLVEAIMVKKTIPTYLPCKIAGHPRLSFENDIPLYLAVSGNGPFDGKIRKKYESFLTQDRIVFSEQFGYFDLIIYDLNGAVSGRQLSISPDNVMQSDRRADILP